MGNSPFNLGFMPNMPRINRPIGNAQARNPAMGRAPAYGNTTNPNGAQTAAQANPYGFDAASMIGLAPTQQQPQQFATPAQPQYPGGDVVGISSYYRNAAQQNYNPQIQNSPLQSNAQPQQQPSAVMDDYSQAAIMRGLAGQIDALRAQSQIDNPMVPNSPAMTGFVDPQVEADRRAAPMLARDAARQQNTPPNGMVGFANDPNRYNPTDPAMQARQQQNAADATQGRPMDRGNGRFAPGALDDFMETGLTWREREKKAEFDAAAPDRDRAKKVMNEKRAQREAERAANPEADAERKRKIAEASKARADKHEQFRQANNGMNYRQYDRFQKTRQNISRAVAEGRMDPATAELKLEHETNKAMRRAQGSKMAGIPGERPALPLREMKQGGNLKAQTPDVATKAVETMVTHSPILKSMGLAADTDFDTTMDSVSGMDPSQMTSTQKFEAARHLHEFLLSQLESGNPSYQIEDGLGTRTHDRRIALIGLDALKPGNKDQMVQWFEDLHRQSKGPKSGRMNPVGPNNAPPMGIMPPGARIAG